MFPCKNVKGGKPVGIKRNLVYNERYTILCCVNVGFDSLYISTTLGHSAQIVGWTFFWMLLWGVQKHLWGVHLLVAGAQNNVTVKTFCEGIFGWH